MFVHIESVRLLCKVVVPYEPLQPFLLVGHITAINISPLKSQVYHADSLGNVFLFLMMQTILAQIKLWFLLLALSFVLAPIQLFNIDSLFRLSQFS